MVMIPKDEFTTLFKMIPLISGDLFKGIEGWAHVHLDTAFPTIIFQTINEATRTVMGRGLLELLDPKDDSVSCTLWHPLMLKCPPTIGELPKLYMRAALS